MITAYAWLALTAAVSVAVASVPYAVHGLHILALWLLAGLWAYALWLGRRAEARRYHRHGRPGAHRHLKPPLRRRLRMLARRVRSLRLRRTDTPAPALEPARNLALGQYVQEIQEVFGTAAYIVTGFEDTVPISAVATHPDIRQFARHT